MLLRANIFSLSATTLVIFAALTSTLVLLDWVPKPRTDATSLAAAVLFATSTASTTFSEERPMDTVPVRIEISSIDLDTVIVAPESTDVAVLDRALLTGAVHYPSSAGAGENGTMLLFGHSSYLPVVHNKAFQAFNELGKLKEGAVITVYSTSHAFEYRVEGVALQKAEDTTVWFDADVPLLTLSTCNTFGSKDERWVATARYVGAREL